ncbi:MAG: protein kinase, partial [Actinobacteria bacterium]|nr:protein kinase [Actinomycetota bacterium]
MGQVWRATDTTLDREVAVKLLKVEYADAPAFRARFESEARHAASLQHPGIAAVYDVGEARTADGTQRPYLVMELVEGQPLSVLLRAGEPMDTAVAQDLMAQAADALSAAHAAGIVHRDVKPANLLVTAQRQLKITDFGIARAATEAGLTQTGQVMGTPQYLSPEQARGTTATAASDVYSLGCVAFECLAGRRPFVADSPVTTALAHINQPVPELPAQVPADLARVVRRAMAKAPADRFADAAAFAAALRDPARLGPDPVVGPVGGPVGGLPTSATVVAPAAVVDDRTQVLSGLGPGVAAPAPLPLAEPSATGRSAGLLLLVVAALVAAAVVVIVLVVRGSGDEPISVTPSRTA